MPVITDKGEFQRLSRLYSERKIPICVFGSASFWNTEAVLLAGQKLQKKYGPSVPVALVMAVTYQYEHMAQCPRFTYSQNPQLGLTTHMHLLRDLCDGPHAPYKDIYILPHLDHAHPERDRWALTEGRKLFASVMFDAQTYPLEENIRLTTDYVAAYGKDTVVEGIIDELSVIGHQVQTDTSPETDARYVQKALDYVAATGVDYVVADLGTEQQAAGTGGASYMQSRAKALTGALGDTSVVLHGASSMKPEQLRTLGEDGVARLNMWTRIARESGIYAAEQLEQRRQDMQRGDFESADTKRYLYDCAEKASDIMLGMMELVGYSRL